MSGGHYKEASDSSGYDQLLLEKMFRSIPIVYLLWLTFLYLFHEIALWSDCASLHG